MEVQRATHTNAGTLSTPAGVGGKKIVATTPASGRVLYAEPDDLVIVKPGDHITLNVTDAATGGDGYPWIQYQRMNWDDTGIHTRVSDALTDTRITKMVDGSTDL